MRYVTGRPTRIVGRAMVRNLGSDAVMQKVGMVRVGPPGGEEAEYEVPRGRTPPGGRNPPLHAGR